MNKIWAIALNTFREAVRNKILYSLLVFALLVILSSLALAQLTTQKSEKIRLAKDLGLGGVSLFGVLIAIFVGVNLLYKEIERKTLYNLLTKPVQRFHFVLGKYLGMVVTLLLQVAVMAVLLVALIYFIGGPVDRAFLLSLLLLFVEIMVITAIAVLFSSFSTPFLSGMFTLGIFVAGRSTPDLVRLMNKSEGPIRGMLRFLTAVLPDLHLFFVSGTMIDAQHVSIHGNYVTWNYVLQATGYGLGYSALVLAIAMVIFSRRDFI
jgi:Cu-processing system permease protein